MKKKVKTFIFSMAIFITAMAYHVMVSGYFLSSVPVIADTRTSVQLPILMYHGITDDSSKVGEYTILASDFEKDLIWLRDHGYTTISPTQLINYVEKGSYLPEKPVLITFDDGYANNYYLAYPLLQKYNAKALISVIGSESDAQCANLSWEQISEMASSGLVQFGNHTYNLHTNDENRKGADKTPGESLADYSQILTSDLATNQEKLKEATGTYPAVFAWPYGAYPLDGSADQILKDLGFKMTLTSYQIKNTIKQGDPDTLFGLKRFLRTPDFDISKII